MDYFLIGLLLIIGAVTIIVSVANLIALINRNPYVSTKPEMVSKMIAQAKVLPNDKAVDIGSGDGRLVVALAQAGAQADGYEINAPLVVWSRIKAWRAGVSKKTKFYLQSYWQADFSDYNLVTLYGLPYVMTHLEPKLKRELPKGARIISNGFRFADWKPDSEHEGVLVYIKD